MQLGLNLSQRQTRTATKIIIKSTGSKNIVEKKIVKKMSKFSHVIDKYFESRTFEFTNEVNDKITKIQTSGRCMYRS